YKERLDEFRGHVRGLLRNLENRTVGGIEYLREQELSDLTQRFHDLAEMVWQLEDLRVSMARQLYNYDEYETTWANDIFRYHRRYIQTTNVELELLVSDGQYALGVADPVLSISRYRTERAQDKEERRQKEVEDERRRKEQEDQQRRREEEDRLRREDEAEKNRHRQRLYLVLAVVGSALAAAELIDREVAVRLAGLLIGWLLPPESFEGNTLAEFAVQFALIVLLILAGLTMWVLQRCS
ncbi:MAG: hypothetical protein ACRDTR_03685, partial [Rubrobacter sp.]